MKANNIASFIMNFCGLSSNSFSGKMGLYLKTLKIKKGNFSFGKDVHQTVSTPSNIYLILPLDFKIANPIF